ncbi:hypothetical protein AMS68_003299 [Peltaster fructicola]|uniref:Uncharacterized protein n=1 Tax=Peltaster fructicola TaxID=286661 RepID=A0A6H0XSN9_9PEZI|nr:hypothetical protein AMS68_003299 [Peltaster fructicola]
MSSYDPRYELHDYRPPRRHDSFTKPREYLNPTTVRNEKSYGSDSGRHDARRADGRYHNSRQRSPHSGLSSDEQRSRQAGLPRRPRHTWPPQPTVESEARSLARELGGSRALRDSARNEIPSRGTIDQDPVIEEVAEYANLHERRFVMVSDSESGRKSQRGVLTPPTSEDERLRKARRRPSRINTEFSDARDGLPKRTASPYAMSRPTALRQHTAPNEALLSPSVSTLHDTHKDRSPRASPSRPAKDYLDRGKNDMVIDDGDDDTRRSTLKGSGTRRSIIQEASSRDTRRATDTAASTQAPRNLDNSYRPSPLVVASALAAATKVAHDLAPKVLL